MLEGEKDSPLEYLSEIQELVDMVDFMQDDALEEAIARTVKLMVKPDIPIKFLAPLIVQYEAWATIFALRGKKLMVLPSGHEPAKRKNFYLSASERFQRMADALKHMNRS